MSSIVIPPLAIARRLELINTFLPIFTLPTHDPYDLCTLTCKPVLIREYAWVGAGATILPGVCIGRHAIVGAGSVVTKDVPDYAVAVGNPAKVIKMLDKEKFQED